MTKTFGMTGLTAAVVIGLVASGGGAPAASVGDNPLSMKIQYTDLDLGSAKGAEVMLKRIQGAAREVCGWAPEDPLFAYYRWAEAACVNATIDKSVIRLNSPMVTAINGSPHTTGNRLLATNR